MAISDADGDLQMRSFIETTIREFLFGPLLLRLFRSDDDLVLYDQVLMLYDPETRESLTEISGLYGDEILCRIFRVVRYHADEARRRLKLNALPEELRRKLEKMAEAKAGVYNLKEKLEVLFELFLYICLILETSTSKQTRRSKEDKCIVHILLLRSGVESNPGPRTWINDIDEYQKPTNSDLIYLSSCIGNGWRHLGEGLYLSQAQLDHIENDYKGMQNQIYYMLLKGTIPPMDASLKEILMIIDDASTKHDDMNTVNWNGIALRFANVGQKQLTIQRDVEDAVLARVADVENKIAALQNEVISLRAENEELKRKFASPERGAQKRNAEEGETSSEEKRLKQE